MQKFLLFLSLVVTATASAQIQRGDRLISTQTTGAYTVPAPSPTAGAEVVYGFGDDYLSVQLGAAYGYAFLDRLLVGTGIFGYLYLGNESQPIINYSPFVRYYVLNRSDLMVFGQLESNLGRAGENYTAFNHLGISAGVQLPLAPDVFFTPRLQYQVQEGRNSLGLQTALEVRMRAREGDEKPVGRVSTGQIMIGANSANLGGRRNALTGGLRLGGHYFVADRLAIGAQLGAGYSSFEPIGPGQSLSSSNYSLGASTRYYFNDERHTLWFVEGAAGHRWQRQEYQGADPFSISFTTVLMGGGAQIFIREGISLEVAPRLNYYFNLERVSLGVSYGLRFSL